MAALAIAYSRALRGLRAPPVRVEVHLANGLPSFMIVGLPEAAVRESRERVRAALLQSGYEFPNRRITVNLAPADLPKDSGRFDLPIAAGILAASGQLPIRSLDGVEMIGELSLGGELRPVHAALALCVGLLQDRSGRSLILPVANLGEARLCHFDRLIGATTLRQVCDHLRGVSPLAVAAGPVAIPTPAGATAPPDAAAPDAADPGATVGDLADVLGQPLARRALEIAAAGHHHLLLTGPPGTGKSLLALRLAGLLPALTDAEALESATIGSATGRLRTEHWRRAPMRTPHHSVSVAGLIGGGQPPRPGEISLAHHGVLFLDELPEYRRAAVEALREPLETGRITIARGPVSECFPARFLLVAAMNPCPCGYLGDTQRACSCTPDQIRRYRARISGPLLDRFDLCVDVRRESGQSVDGRPGTAGENGRCAGSSESTLTVRRRVEAARRRQLTRQPDCNGRLDLAALDGCLAIAPQAGQLAAQASRRFHWSMRGLHRTLRVARTIADLAGFDTVEPDHVAEAIALRRALEAEADRLLPAFAPTRQGMPAPLGA